MSTVTALLDTVTGHGCTLTLDGETVRLRAPQPLPDDVLAELREHKAEVIDFLAARQRNGVPVEWIEGVDQILASGPLGDWRPGPWEALQAALPAFMKTWAPKAATAGWSTLDVFGCHPGAPFHRLDCRGLALCLYGARIVALAEHSAGLVFVAGGNARMTFRKAPASTMAQAVPLWTLLGQ